MSNSRTGFKKLMPGKSALWDIFLTGLAELVGTTILMFLGCMGCVDGLGVTPPHLQINLSFGLTVMIVIQCFGHISDAHVNPAITAGSIVLGKKTVAQAAVYFLSQLIGSVIGYGLLMAVTPRDILTHSNSDVVPAVCITGLNPRLSWIQGLLAETLATGVLMLIACATWDRRNARNTDSVALKFGFAVTALGTVVGPYTGCSMNPVRSFAPAIWNNSWSHHWIYWLGPFVGSTVAALFYRTIFGRKGDAGADEDEDEDERIAETVALHSVDGEKLERIR